MKNTPEDKSHEEKLKPVAERDDERIEEMPEVAGGNGYKKKGGETSSSRWGEEWLSVRDFGQHPEKIRTPSEREASDFDDNTTAVGQPGDRQNLGGSNRWEDEVSSGGLKAEPFQKRKK
jgi:hypothetical protein